MAVNSEKTQSNTNEEQIKKATSYTKEQILSADKYRNRRDLVNALLVDGKSYTMAAVDKKIADFMKGKVK